MGSGRGYTMMNFKDVRALVERSPKTGRAIQELHSTLRSAERVEEFSRGTYTVSNASVTYQIRAQTAREAGVDVWGVDEFLTALGGLESSSVLLVFHFTTADRYFSVFIGADEEALVGCLSVPRRFADGVDHR